MTSIVKTDDLHIRQYKTGCLAQYSYVIESQGEIAIVDPLRDLSTYMAIISESKAKLVYVLETHYHADFVSGHVDLARLTGATIVFGPEANPEFPAKIAKHDELLPLGSYKIRVLHTPGHTFESSCFVIENTEGKQIVVFTGDTLFLGDVGRPDLAQKGDFTDKDLARFMFKSLKLLKALPDETIMLPAHGAGSACGKNIQAGDFCIIGNQKKSNKAFAEEDENAFVTLATDNVPAPPSYFSLDVALNKSAEVDQS
jgi:hydroxyacylglutathione hydrolase